MYMYMYMYITETDNRLIDGTWGHLFRISAWPGYSM